VSALSRQLPGQLAHQGLGIAEDRETLVSEQEFMDDTDEAQAYLHLVAMCDLALS